MPQQFSNNARASLLVAVSAIDTTLLVTTLLADSFPTANTGTSAVGPSTNWFKVTLEDSAGNVEIVYVRTRVSGSNSLSNVQRGQEGTTARSFGVGSIVSLRLTAQDHATLRDLAQTALETAEAAVPSADLALPGAAGQIGVDDGASGTLFTKLQGFINYLFSTAGAGRIKFSRAINYAVNTIGARLKADAFATDAPYNAVGDNSTDNSAAFALIKTDAEAGVRIHFPRGIYRSTTPLRFTNKAACVTADYGTRIRLTANNAGTPWNYVMEFDYTASGFAHGGKASNFILDGGGFARDGLSCKAVISAVFPGIMVTNVTRAGMHLHWAQLCSFPDYICSGNVEAFTTTPVNGLLVDTASSSANSFANICIEKVSGDGIKAESLINSVIIGGTSEGNGGAGVRWGSPSGALVCLTNTIQNVDLEVNAGGDIVCEATSDANSHINLGAGFATAQGVLIKAGSGRHTFIGGTLGDIDIEAGAEENSFTDVSLLGAGATLTDAAPATNKTRWKNIRNITDNTLLADGVVTSATETTVAGGGTYNINAKLDGGHCIFASGATLTIANPTNPQPGRQLTITIFNISGGALTTTWGSNIRTNGWADPANGANRTIVLQYLPNFGRWYPVAMTTTDAAN